MKSILCWASAGSGKTRRLVEEVHNLLNKGVNPKKILIISYTKNAVEEISQRLSNSNEVNLININTFHGFCYDYLVKNNIINNIKLLDKRPKIINLLPENFLEEGINLWEMDYILTKNSVENIFYTYFNKEDYRNNYPFKYFDIQWKTIETIIKIVDFIKNTLNLWTFGDLVIEMYKLLLVNNSTSDLWNLWEEYDGIFIDEFQDFSPMQIEILSKLFQEFIFNIHSISYNKLFFIFGDFKQSIFNFQGANLDFCQKIIENLIKLAHHYQYPLITENINTTYRLSKNNIDLINNLFPIMGMKNFSQHITASSIEGIVEVYNPKPQDNTDGIIKIIGKNIENILQEGYKLEDIMIIFRNRDNLVNGLSQWLKSYNYSSGLDIIYIQNDPIINLLQKIMDLLRHDSFGHWQNFIADYGFNFININDGEKIINGKNLDELLIIMDNYQQWNDFMTWKKSLKNFEDIYGYDFIYDIFFLDLFKPITRHKNNGKIMEYLLESSKKFQGNIKEFLQWLPNNFPIESTGIKMETIYGSKGLQSKIVIMIDGNKGPIGNQWQYPYFYGKNKFIEENEWVIQENNYIFQEYLRLMYVGLTRSQERLYIYGTYPIERFSLLYFLEENKNKIILNKNIKYL